MPAAVRRGAPAEPHGPPVGSIVARGGAVLLLALLALGCGYALVGTGRGILPEGVNNVHARRGPS